jgi:hypothetical protein
MNEKKSFITLRKLTWKILRAFNLAASVQLILESGLKEDGWFNSYKANQSVDEMGNSIPWNTYSFTKFIKDRLNKTFDIFEYGSGNSTLWYAKRVNKVVCVENDINWYNAIKNQIPQNVTIIYRELIYDGDYSREVANHNTKFHLINIDGRDRINCVKNTIRYLTSDGVIIFDNSNIEDYKEGILFLEDKKFKHIDFWGMAPITSHNSCTSIFYKEGNCLNI